MTIDVSAPRCLIAALLAGLMNAAPAGAQDAPPTALSAEATLVSDYIYRGQSLSDGHAAIQASTSWSNAGAARFGGLHAEAWASSIDFGPGDPTDAELSATLGYEIAQGDITFDAGLAYFVYAGAPRGGRFDYLEIYGAAMAPLAEGQITAAVHFTPRNSGDTGPAVFTDIGISWPLGEMFAIEGEVGHAQLDPLASPDYIYWQAGVSAQVHSVTFAVRYHGSDLSLCSSLCGNRVVVAVAKAF